MTDQAAPAGQAAKLPSNLAAVVFDLDGTLVDSAAELADALDRLLAEYDLPPAGVEATKRMVGDGARLLLGRGLQQAGVVFTPADFEAAFARFIDIYENELSDSSTLYPGARACLDGLARRGLTLGLCTNKPARPTRQLLARLDLTDRFSAVVGGGDTAELKPHPLPLLTVVERLGARPETSLYVGDSRTDLETARAAGLAIALLPSGYGMQPVTLAESDLPAATLEDLTALLVPA